MKTVFSLAIVVGFGGTLAAAHFVPWVSHARLPSHTSVVANGGRAEQFLVRLPVDRIAVTDGEAAGLRAAGAQGAMLLPAQFVSEPLLVEHFKVRDAAGSVIGVAARHWSASGDRATTTWSVLIPSRGTLLLSGPGESRAALEAALQSAGYNAGSTWDGELTLSLLPAGQTGAVTAGTGEFGEFQGSYTETWRVTGVDSSGGVRGTIEIDTITQRSP